MNRTKRLVTVMIVHLGSWETARAVNDVSLMLVPVGGNSFMGNETIAIEAFVVANRNIRLEPGQWDVPCVVTANPGGAGTLTAIGSCGDCDGNGTTVSVNGTPFLFNNGSGGPIYSPSACVTVIHPNLGGPFSTLVFEGASRYLGTILYAVSDCAAGEFDIHFECTDQPAGVCENVPESSNTTRLREDEPPGPTLGPLVSLNLLSTTITVPTTPCCVDQVFGPDSNAYCCEAVQGGCAQFRTVADGCVPAIYGDTYPPASGGDGVIDVDDLLCFHDAFTFAVEVCPTADIWPCNNPDGIYDVDDLVAVLDTFVGLAPCPQPCP